MSNKETLHDITNVIIELKSVLDNLEFEELTDEAKEIQRQAILDSLEGLGLEQKLEAYCQVIAEKKANNDYISAEIARLQKRKKSNGNSIDWLRGNMQSALIATGKQKVDTGLHKISVTKRTKLEFDWKKLEEQGIPELCYKLDEAASKRAIKDLGVEIEGVQEVEKTSIRIT